MDRALALDGHLFLGRTYCGLDRLGAAQSDQLIRPCARRGA